VLFNLLKICGLFGGGICMEGGGSAVLVGEPLATSEVSKVARKGSP